MNSLPAPSSRSARLCPASAGLFYFRMAQLSSCKKIYRKCRELLQARVHQIGRMQKAIAADMDLSPSHLARKLAQAPGDSARLTLDDFERYLQTNDDRKCLHYLNAKYGRGVGLASTLSVDELQAELSRRNQGEAA